MEDNTDAGKEHGDKTKKEREGYKDIYKEPGDKNGKEREGNGR